MDMGLKILKQKIYEENGISLWVEKETIDFIDKLCYELNNIPWGYSWNPNVKKCGFNYNFGKEEYIVEAYVFNFINGGECIIEKNKGKFYGSVNSKDKTIFLNLGLVCGKPCSIAFDDIIKHEIQHIYKIMNGGDIKPSETLMHNTTLFSEEFYNKLNDIMKYSKDYKIRKIAYALYSSFEFERNGFIGGLDGVFDAFNDENIDIQDLLKVEQSRVRKLQSTGCYKAYDNILKVLDFIDEMSDSEIYHVFGYYRHKLKKILEISKEKYLKGMSRVIMKHSNIWGNKRKLLKQIREGYNMGRLNAFTWLL